MRAETFSRLVSVFQNIMQDSFTPATEGLQNVTVIIIIVILLGTILNICDCCDGNNNYHFRMGIILLSLFLLSLCYS